MPASPAAETARRARSAQADLRGAVRAAAVGSVVVLATVMALILTLGSTEGEDWRTYLGYYGFVLLFPPALALALTAVAWLGGRCAADAARGWRRWARGSAMLLVHLALALLALEILIGILWVVVAVR